MFKPKCLIPGKEIDNPAEDFRGAQKVEQFRIGRKAIYLPEGLRWNYLPLSEIQSVDGAHRVVNAGHCVTVREERPTLKLESAAGSITLNLEKAESRARLLEVLNNR